jgi:glutathione S-transferase
MQGQPMRVWGRVNSVNVQKVLWCLEELGLPYERIEAGMQHGRVNDADYRALNPNGRVPTLEVDGEVLWESNAILRYLCLRHGDRAPGLYPAAPMARARVDRWLDWQLSTLQPAERPLFWGLVRTRPEQRDHAAIGVAARESEACWRLLDNFLAAQGSLHVEHNSFTLADIVLGAFARRWYGVPLVSRPTLPALEAWYNALQQRPGFRRFVAPPLS